MPKPKIPTREYLLGYLSRYYHEEKLHPIIHIYLLTHIDNIDKQSLYKLFLEVSK